jgi:hypothetical protein
VGEFCPAEAQFIVGSGRMLTTSKVQPLVSGHYPGASQISPSLVGSLTRPYGRDKKPFLDVVEPKNVVLTVLKAAIIPLNNMVNEFNLHAIAQNQRGDDEEIDEFEWSESFNRNMPLFWPNLMRVATTQVIKKSLEELAVKHLSVKMVDRLTKDINKSIVRKYHRWSTLVAGRKVYYTAFWGNALYNLSCFLYDAGLRVYGELTNDARKAWPVSRRIAEICLIILQKAGYYFVANVSGALGYAAGSCMTAYISGSPTYAEYGGAAGGLLVEVAGQLVYGSVFGV